MRNNIVLCEPDFYYSSLVQSKIQDARSQPHHIWVYNIEKNQSETVLFSCDEFNICIDKGHHRKNQRLLIVYKKATLHTIRDLQESDIKILLHSRTVARKLFQQHFGKKCCIFFNYLPGTYQLHAHVQANDISRNSLRAHDMNTILRNIQQNSEHYRNALLLTRISSNNILFSTYAIQITANSRIELDDVVQIPVTCLNPFQPKGLTCDESATCSQSVRTKQHNEEMQEPIMQEQKWQIKRQSY